MVSISDTAAGPGIINLAYLESSSFGQRDFVLHAIDILIEQLPEQVKELNDAILQANWPQVKHGVHKIKSTVALLGMESIKPVLSRIETSSYRMEEVEGITQIIEDACARALAELKERRPAYL